MFIRSQIFENSEIFNHSLSLLLLGYPANSKDCFSVRGPIWLHYLLFSISFDDIFPSSALIRWHFWYKCFKMFTLNLLAHRFSCLLLVLLKSQSFWTHWIYFIFSYSLGFVVCMSKEKGNLGFEWNVLKIMRWSFSLAA